MRKFILFLIPAWLLLSHAGFAQIIWKQVPFGITGNEIYTMKMDDNGVLFVGLLNDIYYTSDYGTNWYNCSNWPGYHPTCFGFNSIHHVFAGTLSNGMLRSTNGGNSFTEINNELTFMNIRSIVVLKNDDILIGTPGGIFKSENSGDNWALYGTGLPDDEIMKLADGGNGRLFAGTKSEGIYRSLDNGATWTETSTGLPDTNVVTSLLAVTGSNLVYAGLFPEGLYSSSDDGNTWIEDNQGLPFPKSSFTRFGISITNMQQLALIAILLTIYQYGVYMGTLPEKDIAIQWIQVNEGLPDNPHVTCLTVSPQEDVFLGAADHGLFTNKFPVQVPQISGMHEGYSVANIPNPFTTITRFTFTIPGTSHVTLKLYNPLGQELITLADRVYQRGSHQITWEPSGISPGIYIYTLQTDGIISAGKLLLTP